MPVWYDMDRHRQSDVGFPTPPSRGGDTMTVYESLSLMIMFGTLIAILCSFHKK